MGEHIIVRWICDTCHDDVTVEIDGRATGDAEDWGQMSKEKYNLKKKKTYCPQHWITVRENLEDLGFEAIA